MQHICYHI